MNSNRNLLKRLLKLYPIKVVKEYFQETGNFADAIESITGNNTQQSIKDFAKKNYLYTKQHIYLYSINSNFRSNIMANFPIDIEDQSNSGGEYFYFCLPKINYKVTLFDPLAEDDLKFLQPLVIKIKNRILTIHFTKLEKTVSSYYPDNRAASRRSQSNHEAETLNKIISFFNTNFQTLPLDINKGVKHLWDNDHIDCRKVQWRRTSSVAMETMDEDLTFKEQYPIEYPKLITQPLSKALFKHLKEDEYLCDVFEADASKGLINIPRFPKDEKQVENVVTEILTNN